MRSAILQVMLALAFQAAATATAAAEEFKYYVWIDEEGIVHAEEEAPKGVDYQVRIIEDINANVVPAEDFRPYGEAPADAAGDSSGPGAAPSSTDPSAGDLPGQAITPDGQ